MKDLNIKFTLRGQVLHALRGVSLDVFQGESLAIVGESGSGKSVFVKSRMEPLSMKPLASRRPIEHFTKTDLPEPDSPTMARLSPWYTSRDTPRIA